jgi:hypothetical protein
MPNRVCPSKGWDNLELWLLDAAAQMPLALLRSAKGDAAPPPVQQAVWQPTPHDDIEPLVGRRT